jgi:thymidylate kinase
MRLCSFNFHGVVNPFIFWQVILNMYENKGYIVITGVDGSGKSSVIEALQGKLAKNAKLYVIPSDSVPQQRAGGQILNHALPRRTVVLSLLKLFWRGLDWFLKYHFSYAPLLRQGYIILGDRFYMDELLLDPLKRRYNAPVWLTQHVRDILPHPDVYILLDAPAEILFARKQETDFEEVGRLRNEYLKWVQQQPCYYLVDASLPFESVVEETNKIIMAWLQRG